MDKKKLLITMGDSVTEGVGCYDYSKMSKMVPYSSLDHNERIYQTNRFHELGWPNRLGKKLNYDRVINIGLGGTGQSAHVKLFFEKILPQDLSEYDVLVVWLLTEPSRFSFYCNGVIKSFQPDYSDDANELSSAYFKQIFDLYNDSILETIFYIKTIEQVCQNNNFNLQITSWDFHSLRRIFKIHRSNSEMIDVFNNSFLKINSNLDEYTSLVCSHPNEKGYEILSEAMFDSIRKHKPEYINKNKTSNLEWQWIGSPIKWKNII